MDVKLIFNKKEHHITIHKLDSILSVKNIVNKIIFKEEYELNDIELYYNNKLLKNIDYCDKYKIKEKDTINVHLKKKGGNIMKKILFYIACIIIILIPFFVLPTGINTGGVHMISLVMSKAKDQLARFLACELKYNTLVKRLSTVIWFIKHFLFIMATYVLITVGCITACLMVKGKSINDDPDKICSPYYVGSVTGLILTVIYFFIYFAFRYLDKFLVPLERWAKQNFVTNMLFVPILAFIRGIFEKSKFLIVYILPFFGQSVSAFHLLIDNIFPGLLFLLQNISKVGCSAEGLQNVLKMMNNEAKNLNEKLNNDKENSLNNSKNNENNNKKSNNCSSGENNKINNNKGLVNAKLYNIEFKNGVINNASYQAHLETLREAITPKPDPLCVNPEGSCCNKDIMGSMADEFYNMLNITPVISETAKQLNLYFGVNLALIGMYEYALYNDEVPLDFRNKSIVERKILLRLIFDNKKSLFEKDKCGKTDKKGVKLLNEIEKIIVGKDLDFPDEAKFKKLEEDLLCFVHKDDLDAPDCENNVNMSPENKAIKAANRAVKRERIMEINNRIAELEARNIEYAKINESNYKPGKSITKTFIKNVFITAVCNVFSTTKAAENIINEIGGVNDLMDILKCGSASGVIMALIYIIVIIVLIICGFFGLY